MKLNLFGGMTRAGVSYFDLWVRYLAVGGDANEMEPEAYICGLLQPTSYQHDMIAQALNEISLENGEDHPVKYIGPADIDA